LGKAVARRIIAEGGAVSLWDMNPPALQAARDELHAAHIAAVDVSDHAEVARAAREANEALGRIDILVASAGITGATAPVEDFPVDSWRRTFAVNVDGVFHFRKPSSPADTAEPDRLHALENSHGAAGRGGGKRGNDLLHGQRRVQFHDRVDVRHIGRAHDILTIVC
jgi:NAD(P)-dependent dehydrogenase (short-subunit alcohol dehydrogenase family)